MFTKPEPSLSYQLLHVLSQRKKLNHEEVTRKRHLKRGLEGEERFFNLLQESLVAPCIPIFNLQLEVNMNEFQIDCLLIFYDVIYLIEVKNYYGDYKVAGDHWENIRTKTSIKNPLHQLTRSNMLLKSWLNMHQVSLPIIPRLAFVNTNFFLYEASESMPIIFPSQHGTFLKNLHVHTQSLSNQEEQLVAKLKSAHIKQSRHEYIPNYIYDELSKNVFCQKCFTAILEFRRKYFYCHQCGNRELVEIALFRSIKEFQLLFPETSIQVNTIERWIGNILSKNKIRHCLLKHFRRQGNGRGTYYL